jgi:hypothetical protein
VSAFNASREILAQTTCSCQLVSVSQRQSDNDVKKRNAGNLRSVLTMIIVLISKCESVMIDSHPFWRKFLESRAFSTTLKIYEKEQVAATARSVIEEVDLIDHRFNPCTPFLLGAVLYYGCVNPSLTTYQETSHANEISNATKLFSDKLLPHRKPSLTRPKSCGRRNDPWINCALLWYHISSVLDVQANVEMS